METRFCGFTTIHISKRRVLISVFMSCTPNGKSFRSTRAREKESRTFVGDGFVVVIVCFWIFVCKRIAPFFVDVSNLVHNVEKGQIVCWHACLCRSNYGLTWKIFEKWVRVCDRDGNSESESKPLKQEKLIDLHVAYMNYYVLLPFVIFWSFDIITDRWRQFICSSFPPTRCFRIRTFNATFASGLNIVPQMQKHHGMNWRMAWSVRITNLHNIFTVVSGTEWQSELECGTKQDLHCYCCHSISSKQFTHAMPLCFSCLIHLNYSL